MSVFSVIKKAIPQDSPVRLLWHKSKSFAAALRYGFPARNLTVIGITGTDGKTTTVGMTAHIMHESGIAVGALTTAFFRIRGKVEPNPTQKTSPSPFMIQAFLRRLVNEGCTHAVLECSSHGLVQGRLDYTWPRVAGITNLTPEHLDYHRTMQEYLQAKAKLFHMLGGRGTKVLNAEDDTVHAYRLIPTQHTVLYANDASRHTLEHDRNHEQILTVNDVVGTAHAVSATMHASLRKGEWQKHMLTVGVPGTYNIENAQCAIGCAHACGVRTEAAVHALASFSGVGGRLERIDEGQNFTVFVDFTVTPAAYEKTLSTVREMLSDGKRLMVLTGSCGDRMKEKRPVVGAICSRLADVMVVSNEDPYTEDPEKIIDEVLSGADRSRCEVHRIVDRLEGIKFLLKHAHAGDIVLLCAKGSDTTMMVKNSQIPWDERKITRDLLKAIK